jgi:hypothetical protein
MTTFASRVKEPKYFLEDFEVAEAWGFPLRVNMWIQA